MVARALAMIEVLDQAPAALSRHGLIIEPLFMQASDMANALNSILRAEGYESSVGAGAGGSVVLLALQGLATRWSCSPWTSPPSTTSRRGPTVTVLDASRKDSVEEAVFTYEVRNTQAEELDETLNQLLGAGDRARLRRRSRSRESHARGRGVGGERSDSFGATTDSLDRRDRPAHRCASSVLAPVA